MADWQELTDSNGEPMKEDFLYLSDSMAGIRIYRNREVAWLFQGDEPYDRLVSVPVSDCSDLIPLCHISELFMQFEEVVKRKYSVRFGYAKM